MNEKTLKEIKQMDWGNLKPLQMTAISYLIERVQGLEEENKFQTSETHKNLDKVFFFNKENQHYKRVLEFYADERNSDKGERARQALRGELKTVVITSDLIGASETIREIMDDFMDDFLNATNLSKREIIMAAKLLRLQGLLMDMGILIGMEGSE